MADHGVTDADLAELIEVASEGTSAFIRGDMRRYFALMMHADDFTLMGPTGEEVTHGSEVSEELGVVVGVERQRGEVGDYPARVRTGSVRSAGARRRS